MLEARILSSRYQHVWLLPLLPDGCLLIVPFCYLLSLSLSLSVNILISSYKDTSHTDVEPTSVFHFNIIMSLKAVSPNMVPF